MSVEQKTRRQQRVFLFLIHTSGVIIADFRWPEPVEVEFVEEFYGSEWHRPLCRPHGGADG